MQGKTLRVLGNGKVAFKTDSAVKALLQIGGTAKVSAEGKLTAAEDIEMTGGAALTVKAAATLEASKAGGG